MSLVNDDLRHNYDVCVACGCEDLPKSSPAWGPETAKLGERLK